GHRDAPLRANFRHRVDFMLHSQRLWSGDGVQCGLDCQLKIGITRSPIVSAVQKFPRSVRSRIQIEDVSINGYAATFFRWANTNFRRANANNYARAESPITLRSIHSLRTQPPDGFFSVHGFLSAR